MPRIIVFNSVTLDGYFTGEHGDLSWAHNRNRQDPEWKSFIEQNAQGEGVLVFGRVTYEMMQSYWPTPQAMQNDPVVAQRMNALPKLVFSRTLAKADWNNTRVLNGDPAGELRKLKQAPGPDMVIMGSGTIVSRLAQAGLIDEYQLVAVPVALGKGRTLFEGITKPVTLTPTRTRSFQNGNVFTCYAPGTEAGTPEAAERGDARTGRPEPAGTH